MAEAPGPASLLMSNRVPAVLANRDAFFRAMSKFVENECHDEGADSVSFLLAQIKQVVRLFSDMGLQSLVGVYTAVTEHGNATFQLHSAWKMCSISGTPCRKTLYINDNTFVSTRYEKWVKSVWLAAHIHVLERSRRHERYSVKRIEKTDAEIYRLALKTVFESFLQVYATIRSDRHSRVLCRLKKNIGVGDAASAAAHT